MSKDKAQESVKINLDDLQNFASHSSSSTTPSRITNWLSLNSQMHLDGLKTFRTALYSPYVTGATDSMKNLRNGYLTPLLEDLEKLSKREEITSKMDPKLPEFNDSFYNEVNKPDKDRTPEFKDFLQKYSELTVEGHYTEKISAQMLVDVGKEAITIGELKESLEANLQSYKQDYASQTKKDLGVRELILLKDKSGETKAITMQELASSKDVLLTGEQRDFIQTAWQQGSFAGGWFSASTAQFNEAEKKLSVFSQNTLLIDTSVEGKVLLSNQVTNSWKTLETNEITGLHATGTLIVDVSELKGDKFIPGCASSKPKIDVIISKHDKEVDFIPPKLQKTTSPKFESLGGHITNEFKKGYYNTAKSENGKLAEMALRQLQDDPLKYKFEIEKFMLREKDPEKIEKFAGEQIDKFSTKQTAKLNSVEKDRIKQGLITILEPLCKDKEEIVALKNNAGKLVRQCAASAGKDMSWREAWKSFVDKTKNIVSKTFGKKNSAEKLANKYPHIMEKLRNNMSPSRGNKAATHAKPKKDIEIKR